MNLESFKALATSKIARQALVTQKYSPKILFVAGAVGVVGATVLACRATLQMDAILEHHEKHVDYIREEAGTEQISHEDANKQIMKVKLKTGLEIAKVYAPAAGVMLTSVAALTGSHVILTKRNAGAMAAYAGLDKAYKQYRQNVVDKHGEDEDREFAAGAKNVHVEEKTADGKTKITVKSEKDSSRSGSPYAALFDEHSHKFTREPGMNHMIVGMQQSHANDKLRANGHLFLNEVHDMLGLPRTKAGAVVGWVYRKDNEEKTGDNYVSFGIFDGDLERAEAFIDGDETSVWLDFNVDGVILDLI